jgi:hypothetical protein
MNTTILDDNGEWNYPEGLRFHVPGLDEPTELQEDERLRHRQMVSWCLVQRFWYYVLNSPQVTDQEYDAVERQVKDMEESAEYLRHNPYSPSRRVGSCRREDYPRSVRSCFPLETFKPVVRKIEVSPKK